MILVLLGTQHNEFKRLLEEIDRCIEEGIINEEVIVQAGFTKYESKNLKIFDMISKEKLDELIDKANFIITHGGVGSIILGLNKNKKVIAVPRLTKYHEHVNDHQTQIVDIFNKKGYLLGIKEIEDLEIALKNIYNFIPEKYEGNNKKIIDTIDMFIQSIK